MFDWLNNWRSKPAAEVLFRVWLKKYPGVRLQVFVLFLLGPRARLQGTLMRRTSAANVGCHWLSLPDAKASSRDSMAAGLLLLQDESFLLAPNFPIGAQKALLRMKLSRGRVSTWGFAFPFPFLGSWRLDCAPLRCRRGAIHGGWGRGAARMLGACIW